MHPIHHRTQKLKRPSSASVRSPHKRLLLIILTAFFFIIAVVIYFFQIKHSLWSGQGRITLVIVQADQIGLLSYDSDKAVWISLPPQTEVDTLAYGKYPLESLWQLGEQENIGGGPFLTRALSWELGIGIDGYINTPQSYLINMDNSTPANLLSFNRLIPLIFWQKTTNLSAWDISRLFWQLGNLRQDKIKQINLETAGYGKRLSLPDGQEVFVLDKKLFPSRLAVSFLDSQINTPLPVVVINRTNITGLATKASQIINSAGGQVAQTETDVPLDQSGCEVQIPSPFRHHPLVEKLTRWFDCSASSTTDTSINLIFFSLKY